MLPPLLSWRPSCSVRRKDAYRPESARRRRSVCGRRRRAAFCRNRRRAAAAAPGLQQVDAQQQQLPARSQNVATERQELNNLRFRCK
eukprot:5348868-Pleurochrysis_carterae.AAC.1